MGEKLAERENEARKQRKEEDSEAVASFEQERKRFRPEDSHDASFMANVQRQQREKAAADRAKAAASASQRAKCQFKVRKANDAPAAAAEESTPKEEGGGGLIGLGGYASD